FFSAAGQSQQLGEQNLSQLRESPAGSKVIQYLELYNSGDTLDEAVVARLFSERLIAKYSPEALAGIMEDARQRDGKLELYEAVREEIFRYQLLCRSLSAGDWLQLTFDLEKQPPYRIDGIGISGAGTGPEEKSPIYSPDAQEGFQPSDIEWVSTGQMAARAAEIAREYEEMGWFSGVILMAKGGDPFFLDAFGYADLKAEQPNRTDTKFRIGSINKDFTAVLVLRAARKGILSLDDKLARFDLGFPREIALKVTVRQLLSHSAGFGDIFIPEYLNDIRAYKDIDDILPLLRDKPLLFEPGTDTRYSNYGYILLGAILEKASGKQFARLLQEEIYEPIGLESTHYDIAENIPGEAQSYRFTPSGEKVDVTARLEYCTPDGGMYATAEDLLTFFQALFFSDKLLTEGEKTLFVNDFQTSGQAWEKIRSNPRAGAGYAGGGPGVNAVAGIAFKDEYITIILANTDQQVAEEIYQRIRMAMRGRPHPAPTLPEANYLYAIWKEKGTAYLGANIAAVMDEGGYGAPGPSTLNRLGFALMRQGKLDDAIEIFRLNTALYPEEANPYDSLAEALLEKGEREEALKYYRKALELDPDLSSAKERVKELEGN
ncbi:MAG: serine hydrolase, partial [Saprospiraceae bacterium]|nr:serine hydrolase [Saprospiraceae bacterium]